MLIFFYKAYIIHMTTSMSRRLNMLSMMFKVRIQSHLVLTEEGNVKYQAGNYIEALLLCKEAISDLKSSLATFPCRELAVLFGNMSDCHMQLDDIEQSYKDAVACNRYDL
jgi:hypothetical protein